MGRALDRFATALLVTIRPCTFEDLDPLEWHGLHSDHRGIFAEVYARHLSGEVMMLVAEANRFPVGQVWIDLIRGGGRAGVLWALRVIPCLRGLGIGGRLVAAAEEVLRARRLPAAELGVRRDNRRVLPFYTRRGYRAEREGAEEYSYTTPDGRTVRERADMLILRKPLG